MTDRAWLDVPGAAARPGVSNATILRAARSGRLKGYKIANGRLWRFRPEDVDAWVMGQTTPVLVDASRHGRRTG